MLYEVITALVAVAREVLPDRHELPDAVVRDPRLHGVLRQRADRVVHLDRDVARVRHRVEVGVVPVRGRVGQQRLDLEVLREGLRLRQRGAALVEPSYNFV